jgi:hypothetical protein
MSNQPTTPPLPNPPSPLPPNNDDGGEIIGEIYLVPHRPKFKMEPLVPGSEHALMMMDVRHDLVTTDDAGYATFANMVNTRELTEQDGEKPKVLAVVRPERTGDFTLGLNFGIYDRLSHLARKEFLKEQMLRIPYGHFSQRAQDLVRRYGQEIVERAGQIVLSQVIDPSILAEEGIILPVPEMWEFDRNLTMEEYADKLWDQGGGAGSMPSPIKVVIKRPGDGQGNAKFFAKCNDPELQDALQDLLDKHGLTKFDSMDDIAQGDGAHMDSCSRDFMNQAEVNLQASNHSLKSQGFMAGDAEQFIEALNRQPRIRWQSILRSKHGQHESRKRVFNPRKPSRRGDAVQMPDGSLFEFYKGRSRDKTVVALWIIDTSGSMGEEELRCIEAELRGMRANGAVTFLIQVDAGVCTEPMQYSGFDKLERFFGRGGTDFRPGFEYAHDMCPRPDYIVYFTDGMGTAPDEESEIDTLWVLTSTGYDEEEFRRRVCEWGDSVVLEVEDN